jgi:hypothetical protein
MKPVLKALGAKLLILKCDEMLSNSAFSFKLRRYILDSHLVRITRSAWNAAGGAASGVARGPDYKCGGRCDSRVFVVAATGG